MFCYFTTPTGPQESFYTLAPRYHLPHFFISPSSSFLLHHHFFLLLSPLMDVRQQRDGRSLPSPPPPPPPLPLPSPPPLPRLHHAFSSLFPALRPILRRLVTNYTKESGVGDLLLTRRVEDEEGAREKKKKDECSGLRKAASVEW